MSCRFCGGTGRRYRPWGSGPCLACDGMGDPLPRWNSERGGKREEETTRAADEGGPTREHGGPDKAEEDSALGQGSRKGTSSASN